MLTSTNTQNRARRYVVLILALVGLIGAATLLLGPSRLASAQAIGSWSFTGGLNQARLSPLMIQLQNGKVLVAGGYTYDQDSEPHWQSYWCPLVRDATCQRKGVSSGW